MENKSLDIRIEALKMAYELAIKIGHFSTAFQYENGTKNIATDLEDVFTIADMNIDYLINKKDN
jgi:hypothetical protein